MTKVLLLGVGRWGANHLRVASSLPLELFVADPAPAALELAARAGVPRERLATEPYALMAQVDAVLVATPAPSHFELCQRALAAGKDVFVEKPITLHSEQARELTQLAERSRRILQVGHIFRFDAASQWLRDAVAAGEFGRLRYLRASFSGFKRPRTDTGVLFADGIHFVDLFNFILGRGPTRVRALTCDFLQRGMEDQALVLLDYPSFPPSSTPSPAPGPEIMAQVEAGYHIPGKWREVTVVGERLSAVCDYNVAQYKIRTFGNRHQAEAGQWRALEGESHQLEFSPEEPLHLEWRAFLDSLTTRARPLADGHAGYEAVRIIEAALESAASGRAVELAASR